LPYRSSLAKTFHGYGNGAHLATQIQAAGRENVFVSTGIPCGCCGGDSPKITPMNATLAMGYIDDELSQVVQYLPPSPSPSLPPPHRKTQLPPQTVLLNHSSNHKLLFCARYPPPPTYLCAAPPRAVEHYVRRPAALPPPLQDS
jgi:hypothetical protein